MKLNERSLLGGLSVDSFLQNSDSLLVSTDLIVNLNTHLLEGLVQLREELQSQRWVPSVSRKPYFEN